MLVVRVSEMKCVNLSLSGSLIGMKPQIVSSARQILPSCRHFNWGQSSILQDGEDCIPAAVADVIKPDTLTATSFSLLHELQIKQLASSIMAWVTFIIGDLQILGLGPPKQYIIVPVSSSSSIWLKSWWHHPFCW